MRSRTSHKAGAVTMAEMSRQKGDHAELFVICEPSAALMASHSAFMAASVVGTPASFSIVSKS